MYLPNNFFPVNNNTDMTILPAVTPAVTNNSEKTNQATQLTGVDLKLQDYVSHHNSAKERKLLECHAHCFIVLS